MIEIERKIIIVLSIHVLVILILPFVLSLYLVNYVLYELYDYIGTFNS